MTMFMAVKCENLADDATWAWKITETNFAGETREVAYFRDHTMADSVCRLLNMAATIALNDPAPAVGAEDN
jgi:hypothetical protein